MGIIFFYQKIKNRVSQVFWEPIKNRVSTRSVLLEAVYLEALLYFYFDLLRKNKISTYLWGLGWVWFFLEIDGIT